MHECKAGASSKLCIKPRKQLYNATVAELMLWTTERCDALSPRFVMAGAMCHGLEPLPEVAPFLKDLERARDLHPRSGRERWVGVRSPRSPKKR